MLAEETAKTLCKIYNILQCFSLRFCRSERPDLLDTFFLGQPMLLDYRDVGLNRFMYWDSEVCFHIYPLKFDANKTILHISK